jgi:NAD(P)-dependent dehydrogenase (short-subunit alcohol dehydrogenase family)
MDDAGRNHVHAGRHSSFIIHLSSMTTDMRVRLKPIREQVIVITGASSGIGLVTARMAARRGARVVLMARNQDSLRQLTEEIKESESYGGMAAFVAGDVGDEAAVRRAADEAIRRFGRIDTWVNCAGVSIYGPLISVSLEDQRRLFETNFWGVVHGSRIAVEHLRKEGGALLNIGSTLSDRAVPLQGMYCASKSAVKAYTDSLRMEVEHDGLPIAVTLIQPGAIDTPYTEHAKNYLEHEPMNPSPVYAPEIVAKTILYCAEHPVRDVFAGGGGKMLSAFGRLAPRLTDKVMEKVLFNMQQRNRRRQRSRSNSLYGPTTGLKERGGTASYVSETSLYTEASLHPLITGAVVALGCLALAAVCIRTPSHARGFAKNPW